MKLLIISPDAYSIFHPETNFIFGGIEIETGHHAKGLSELGVEVVVATRNQGTSTHKVGKVTLSPIPELPGKGYWQKRSTLSGRISYRLFGDRPEFKNMEALMEGVNPDVGYIMGMSPEALKLARYCRKFGKGFIFRVAHDKDLIDDPEKMHVWAKVTASEAREVIESANVVLAQTPFQKEQLAGVFNRSSEMMFPPIELEAPDRRSQKNFDVLWIGRSNSFKRPEKLAEIATALPQYKFSMIFNKVEEEDWKRTFSTLPSNVAVTESVPVDKVEEFFRNAKIFLSTSLHEGFPNTFLQAAKNGLPVVSMGSDPNGMLTVYNGGILCHDNVGSAVEAIQKLLDYPQEYIKHSSAARKYVEQFNDSKKINRQFLHLLQEITSSSSSLAI